MKTLVLFEIIGERSFFFEYEGNLGHMHEVYINTGESDVREAELTALVYDEDGEVKVKELTEPTLDWDKFIKCGFVL